MGGRECPEVAFLRESTTVDASSERGLYFWRLKSQKKRKRNSLEESGLYTLRFGFYFNGICPCEYEDAEKGRETANDWYPNV